MKFNEKIYGFDLFLFVLSQLPWYYIIDNLTLQHHTYYHKVPKTEGIQAKASLEVRKIRVI